MNKNDVLSLKVDDVFYLPDFYIRDDCKVVQRPYKCTVLYRHLDGDILHGFLVKRWLVTKKRWSFEFFDVWKTERCSLTHDKLKGRE